MINKLRLQELDKLSKTLSNEELQVLMVMVGARNMQDIFIDMAADDEVFDREHPVVTMSFDNVQDTTADWLFDEGELRAVNDRYNIVEHYAVDLGYVRKPSAICKSFV